MNAPFLPPEALFEPLDLIDPTLADRAFLPGASLAAAELVAARVTAQPLEEPVRNAGVGALLGAFAAGALTPVEALAALTRAVETDPSGSEAVVTAIPDAQRHAAESTRRWRAGEARPLEGVPFAVKDIIDVEGASVTCGSHFTGARRAPADAAVVASLRAAGAIPFVMAATSEFAAGLPNNPRFGPVTNPWDRSRWSGGSSTGSGAGLAARLFPLALGTDTAGSIRVPSCWCGTTGLKPSRELVSRAGVSSLSWTLDHVGPMTRSAADIARVLPFMTASPDPALAADCAALVDRPPGLAGLRVGVPVDWFTERVDAAVLRNWQAALKVLESLGCTIVALPPLRIASLQELGWAILLTELAANHGDRLAHGELLDAGVRARLTAGVEIRAADYTQALRARRQAQEIFLSAMVDIDLIVTPGVGSEAGVIESLTVTIDGVSKTFQEIASRNTMMFDLTGFPALMLPSGLGACGLPTGIQVVARPRADALCLRVGIGFQAATDHHLARPPYLAAG
ncbi:amidase [Bosea sp. ASV33]|uniref:amidase n=1 Tax=Bosea sp. ASV33 TaxID=2795106 RepID=UPI0018EC5516|nr:amidase [Bosea sp. ASV33]